jgi:hypothetical protein
MQALLYALLQRYESIYNVSIAFDGQLFHFEEFLDKHYRESVIYAFAVVEDDELEVALTFRARFPIWVPRTQLYLRHLAYKLASYNIGIEYPNAATVMLKHTVTPASLSYEDDVDEQANIVDGIVLHVAHILHAVRGVTHINKRLYRQFNKERGEKLRPERLVELTLCSWKPNSVVKLC